MIWPARRRLPPIQGSMGRALTARSWSWGVGLGAIVVLLVRRSMARRLGALGPQVVHCPASGALDGEDCEGALTQFSAAAAASDFVHCKPITLVVILLGSVRSRESGGGWPAWRPVLRVGG